MLYEVITDQDLILGGKRYEIGFRRNDTEPDARPGAVETPEQAEPAFVARFEGGEAFPFGRIGLP